MRILDSEKKTKETLILFHALISFHSGMYRDLTKNYIYLYNKKSNIKKKYVYL